MTQEQQRQEYKEGLILEYLRDKVKEKYVAIEIMKIKNQMEIADAIIKFNEEKECLRCKLFIRYNTLSPFAMSNLLLMYREDRDKDIELYSSQYKGNIVDFYHSEYDLIYYSQW